MAHKTDRWFDHTGRSLIRIVIGSYFVAISTGLVHGVDRAALFSAIMTPPQAEQAGSATLMVLSIVFMSGLLLRLSALMLALFVLCSSLIQNQFLLGPIGFSAYWRDMALVCAILLTYAAQRPHGVRKVRWFLAPGTGWIPRGGKARAGVVPRRVTAAGKSARRPARPDYDNMLRPLIAQTGPMVKPQPKGAASVSATSGPVDQARNGCGWAGARLALLPPPDDDECDNIFNV